MTDEPKIAGAVVEELIRIKDSLSSQDQRDTISDACNLITAAEGKLSGFRDAYSGAMEDKRMWRGRAQVAEAQSKGLREALTASRETHCGIAEHILQGGTNTNGIFADSQRARLAIDEALKGQTDV